METRKTTQQRIQVVLRGMVMCGTLAVAANAAAESGVACSDLVYRTFFQTTINSAAVVPADAVNGRPEHCQVNATISPDPGSHIGVVYRLPTPAGWNGKLLGIGGSGWAGDVTIGSATLGLSRGYATLNYTARGWHGSCGPDSSADPLKSPAGLPPGCTGNGRQYWVHLDDLRYEIRFTS